jgi:hypothetical protein
MLAALMVSVGLAIFNCSVKVLERLFSLAVSVADCDVEKLETVAAKLAPVAPAGTVTETGTVTDESLLDKLTFNPPLGAAAVSARVQVSVPAPFIDD